jgi:Ferritin-like domain
MGAMYRQILGTRVSRRQLLGAGTAAAAVAALGAPQARAALAPATPAGDDLGFLAFGAVAEGVLSAYFDAALALRGAWTPAERSRLTQARTHHRASVDRLNAALGPDNAVTPGDFERVVKLGSRAGALKVGRELETLVAGTYLGGVAATVDYGSALLLGRLLAQASSENTMLATWAGESLPGLLAPIDLDAAGLKLDTYIKDPTS